MPRSSSEPYEPWIRKEPVNFEETGQLYRRQVEKNTWLFFTRVWYVAVGHVTTRRCNGSWVKADAKRNLTGWTSRRLSILSLAWSIKILPPCLATHKSLAASACTSKPENRARNRRYLLAIQISGENHEDHDDSTTFRVMTDREEIARRAS